MNYTEDFKKCIKSIVIKRKNKQVVSLLNNVYVVYFDWLGEIEMIVEL